MRYVLLLLMLSGCASVQDRMDSDAVYLAKHSNQCLVEFNGTCAFAETHVDIP